MKRKVFRAPLVLKQDEDERGAFTAVFSTLNVIDHDGDVTVPGAFEDGQGVIVEPWNHGWTLPAGKGVIRADEEKAWVEGKFFMETGVGKEHYETVKGMGDLAEWSYTFDIEEAGQGDFEDQQVQFLRKLDVVGVSPVTRGAGIDTRTVDIKKRGDDVDDDGDEDEAASAGKASTGSATDSGKSSDADLLTRIDLLEMELTLLEVENG